MADFLGMMKQAAQLQTKMQEMQAELDQITVDGTAGGGMVSVTMSAKGDLKGVRIDEQLVKPGEKEIIEDLIVAAHADARRKAEALLAEKMKSLTGGLPLPPGNEAVLAGSFPARIDAKQVHGGADDRSGSGKRSDRQTLAESLPTGNVEGAGQKRAPAADHNGERSEKWPIHASKTRAALS